MPSGTKANWEHRKAANTTSKADFSAKRVGEGHLPYVSVTQVGHSIFLAEQLGAGSERKTKDGKQRQKHPVDGRRKRATLTGFYFSFDPSLIVALPCQLVSH